MAGLFCHAQQNSLTVLERSKAMEIRAAFGALRFRFNLTFIVLLQRTNIDVDQQSQPFLGLILPLRSANLCVRAKLNRGAAYFRNRREPQG